MDKIDEHYELTKSTFDKYKGKICIDIEKSKYKKSLKALFRQQDKIDKLASGLLAISETKDNFYSIQALTRIIIEHFLVGYYIWTKTRLNKDDLTGEEYYIHYDTSEFFKRENFELRIEGIRLNKKNHNTFKNILQKYPEFNDLDEGQLSEIHKTAKQFDLRDILDYLINQIHKNDFSDFHNLMLSALSEYNHLSSYVHGGPTAELETYEGRQNTNKENRIIDCIKSAKIYSRASKEYILLLLIEENIEYTEMLWPIFEKFQSQQG